MSISINNEISKLNNLSNLNEEKDYKTEKTLDDYICKINPYYWVKGNDYFEVDIRKLHPSLKNIKLFELENNISSTIIINKIRDL